MVRINERNMTDRWFKTEQGKLVDIVDHIKEQIQLKDDLKIYLATDSQDVAGKSIYATTVVFRYGIRGCHYVTKILQVPRIKDTFTRLFKEAEITISTAELITSEMPVKFEALEFDYNDRVKTESTKVISAATGWAQSLGYKTRVKPDDMIASKASDHEVRQEEKKMKYSRKKHRKLKKGKK